MLREVDVVVPVDPEDLLDHIAFPGHVDHVGRGCDLRSARPLLEELVGKAGKYLLDGIVSDLLADEGFDAVVIQVDDSLGYLLRIELFHLSDDLAAGDFADQQGCPLAGIFVYLRVAASLEAERSVSLEGMPLGGLADGAGIKICALYEYVGGRRGNSGVDASEHAGYAHRTVGVRDYDVLGRKLALLLVKGHYPFTLSSPSDDHLSAGDLVSVEGMERLAELPEDEVGNVHYVVDRPEADGQQLLLEPFRGWADLDSLHGDAAVPWSGGTVHDLDRNTGAFAVLPCTDVRI